MHPISPRDDLHHDADTDHTHTQLRKGLTCVCGGRVFTLSVVQRHAVRDLHAAAGVDFVVVLLFGCCHDTAASSTTS